MVVEEDAPLATDPLEMFTGRDAVVAAEVFGEGREPLVSGVVGGGLHAVRHPQEMHGGVQPADGQPFSKAELEPVLADPSEMTAGDPEDLGHGRRVASDPEGQDGPIVRHRQIESTDRRHIRLRPGKGPGRGDGHGSTRAGRTRRKQAFLVHGEEVGLEEGGTT